MSRTDGAPGFTVCSGSSQGAMRERGFVYAARHKPPRSNTPAARSSIRAVHIRISRGKPFLRHTVLQANLVFGSILANAIMRIHGSANGILVPHSGKLPLLGCAASSPRKTLQPFPWHTHPTPSVRSSAGIRSCDMACVRCRPDHLALLSRNGEQVPSSSIPVFDACTPSSCLTTLS